MKKLEGYMAGVNLGGWVSQYARNLENNPDSHFDTFITRDDILQIASWGMDHVRLPFDYPLIEDDDRPFRYKEKGFLYIDNCIKWCKEAGLNLVLDLHMAPGFSFGTPDKNTLFSDDEMQERFCAIWQAFARRYKDEGDNILFELLNEIVEPDSTRWNKLATRAIAAIREVDTKHYIVVGGIEYNSVWRLKDMPIFDDPRIVYNFHMYEPGAFTHQHAGWTISKDYPVSIPYPSDFAPYVDFAEYVKKKNGRMSKFLDDKLANPPQRMDVEYINAFLQPAKDFIEAHDLPLYCGEYGVIDNVDNASRAAWTLDVAKFCLENGIGRAIWSYKGMSFTMVDKDGKTLDEDLTKAAALH